MGGKVIVVEIEDWRRTLLSSSEIDRMLDELFGGEPENEVKFVPPHSDKAIFNAKRIVSISLLPRNKA